MAGTIVRWQVATIGMPAKAVRTRLACCQAGSMLTFPPPVGMYQNCPSLALVVARSSVSSGVVPPWPGWPILTSERARPCAGERVHHGLVGLVAVDLDAGRAHEADAPGGRGRHHQLGRQLGVVHHRADDELGHAAVVPPAHLDDVAGRGPEQAGRRGAEDHLTVGQHPADGLAVQLGGRARVGRRGSFRVLGAGRRQDVPTAVAAEGGHAEGAAVEQGGAGADVGRGREGRGLHGGIEVARLRDRDAGRDRSGLAGQDRGWGRRGAGGADEDDGGHQGPPPRDGDAGRRAGAWEGRQGP